MSLTLLEVLKNAKYNLDNYAHPVQFKMAINQLSNVIKQCEEQDNYNLTQDFIEEE